MILVRFQTRTGVKKYTTLRAMTPEQARDWSSLSLRTRIFIRNQLHYGDR